MKKSKVETAETRQRIVEAAAQRLNASGIHATGLADVMADAGLTHGGFYRHFDSKDQLVAEACTVGLEARLQRSRAAADRARSSNKFKAIVESYLSADHRDDRAGGCPFAALASELVRADRQTRAAASQGFERLIQAIGEHLPDQSPEQARAEAAYAVATMVGALTMSRMVDDPELSDLILSQARRRLIDA